MTQLAALDQEAHLEQETTRDSFLNGKIEVLQPVNYGHRSGLDAILLAASLPRDASGVLADLGSGAGVAGLSAIALRSNLELLLVENNPQMAELAFKSINLSGNTSFGARAKLLEADVTLSGMKRQQAGLLANSFDYVIMNPPYLDATMNRISKDPAKADAHIMGEGGLDAWMRTAASILKPSGLLSMIYRAQSIGQIVASMQGRFGGIEIMPIHPKANKDAKLLLVRAVKASRAPTTFVPPVFIHNEDGTHTTRADAILAGEGYLFDD